MEDDNELAWRDLADLSERWRWSNKLASHLYGQGTIPDVAVAQDRVVAVTKTHLVDLDFQQKKDYGTTIAEGASAVAVRREGDVAVYGTQGGELGVVPLTRSDTKPPPPIKAHGGYITSIAFAPDQQLLATSARDRTVRLWQLSGQQLEAVLTIQLPVVAPRVRFTPEGDLVALPYKHNGLRVWRLAALRKQLADMGLDWNASEPAGEPDLSPESAP